MDFYQLAKRYSIEKFTTRENRITDAWTSFLRKVEDWRLKE